MEQNAVHKGTKLLAFQLKTESLRVLLLLEVVLRIAWFIIYLGTLYTVSKYTECELCLQDIS